MQTGVFKMSEYLIRLDLQTIGQAATIGRRGE